MAIPDFQTLMLPVLHSSSEGEVKISDVIERLATQFNLSQQERTELLPSGRQTMFANRVHWAKSYLAKAGLVNLTRRAHFRITDRGREVLKSPPDRIDIRFLSQFPEFKAFRDVTPGPEKQAVEEAVQTTGLAPDEMTRRAHSQLEEELGEELLSRVISAPPDFFERLIVKLTVAMGYGGSVPAAGRALGKSGDDGVDGVIDQDAMSWAPELYGTSLAHSTDSRPQRAYSRRLHRSPLLLGKLPSCLARELC